MGLVPLLVHSWGDHVFKTRHQLGFFAAWAINKSKLEPRKKGTNKPWDLAFQVLFINFKFLWSVVTKSENCELKTIAQGQ